MTIGNNPPCGSTFIIKSKSLLRYAVELSEAFFMAIWNSPPCGTQLCLNNAISAHSARSIIHSCKAGSKNYESRFIIKSKSLINLNIQPPFQSINKLFLFSRRHILNKRISMMLSVHKKPNSIHFI